MPMWVPGARLATRSARRVRSRLMGGIAVLGYHRLGRGGDPLGLEVGVEHFAAHMTAIRRHAHPMRLADAVAAAAAGVLPRRAVAVTFDDGYSDTLTEALPLLERAGVPATVFVTTGYAGAEFWWDELARLVPDDGSSAETLEIEIRGRVHAWHLGPRRGVVASMASDLQGLEPAERRSVLETLRARFGEPANGAGAHRALTEGEVRQLAGSPLVEIGAHSVSHSALPTLAPAVQRHEVRGSRESLESVTGKPVTSFSYPHGACSEATRAVVAEAGYTIACCSAPDVLTGRSHRLAVPRLWVADQDGPSFARWLKTWIG